MESTFALKVSLLAFALALPAWIKANGTAEFYYKEKGLWALISGATAKGASLQDIMPYRSVLKTCIVIQDCSLERLRSDIFSGSSALVSYFKCGSYRLRN